MLFGTVCSRFIGGCNRDVSSLSNHSTTNLTEGDNQYFTQARARGSVSVTDSSGDGSLSYDGSSGVITYVGPTAAETRMERGRNRCRNNGWCVSIGQSVSTTDDVSFGTVTADLTGDVTGDVTGTVSSLSNHSTTNLTEGDNQYFTQARARGSVSVTDSSGDETHYHMTVQVVLSLMLDQQHQKLRLDISGGTGVGITDGVVSIGQSVGTSDNVTFNNLTVSGDLAINGTTTTIDTASLVVEDHLIKLSKDNSADTVDIGFYGLYGSSETYSGLFRDASDSGKWKLFKDLTSEPTTTVDVGGTGYSWNTSC